MVTARYTGPGPGLAATALSALVCYYFDFEPIGSLKVGGLPPNKPPPATDSSDKGEKSSTSAAQTEEVLQLQRLQVMAQMNPFGPSYPINPPGITLPHVIVIQQQEDHELILRLQKETVLLQLKTAQMKAETEHLRAQVELEKAKAELKMAQAETAKVKTGRGDGQNPKTG
jgi:hypothetical protein